MRCSDLEEGLKDYEGAYQRLKGSDAHLNTPLHCAKASVLAADGLNLVVHDLVEAPGEVLVGDHEGLSPSCREPHRLWPLRRFVQLVQLVTGRVKITQPIRFE